MFRPLVICIAFGLLFLSFVAYAQTAKEKRAVWLQCDIVDKDAVPQELRTEVVLFDGARLQSYDVTKRTLGTYYSDEFEVSPAQIFWKSDTENWKVLGTLDRRTFEYKNYVHYKGLPVGRLWSGHCKTVGPMPIERPKF